jgi:hypothetical protein
VGQRRIRGIFLISIFHIGGSTALFDYRNMPRYLIELAPTGSHGTAFFSCIAEDEARARAVAAYVHPGRAVCRVFCETDEPPPTTEWLGGAPDGSAPDA